MSRHKTAKLLLAAALSSVPATVFANGLRIASQDGFASARGEAFVATADNPSAIYYNPAGITQIEGNNFRGGIYGIYYDPTFTPPNGAVNSDNTYEVENNFAAAPNLFYAYTPKEFPLSFGLGLYAPYGGSVEWPEDTGFRAVALQSSLQYVTINPVIALKVLPSFSIGAGVMVNYANLELEQGIRRNQLPPPYTDYFRFQGEGWSVGYNVGALWQPHEKVSIGGNLRSYADVTLEGHTDVQFFPVIATPYRSPAHAGYSFPLTAVIGISYRPTPRWNLEFNADYTDWSSFGTVTIYQERPNNNVQPNPSFILNWQPSWMYEFGVTRYFDNGWHVSAGYVFNENSVPDAHYTPLAADMDRHFLSIGTGRKGKHLDFDVMYQFGYGPPRTVTGSTPSTVGQIAGQTADGTYEFISHAILISAGWHF
jgi:long-chain fatty acid transport protein